MRSYCELKAELGRMSSALSTTEAHRARVWARIESLAEDTVIATRPKARQYGRGRTTWTPTDEREYRRQVQRYARRYAGELGALERKATRQRAAINAFHRSHRFNEPLRLPSSAVPPMEGRREGRDRVKSGLGGRLLAASSI